VPTLRSPHSWLASARAHLRPNKVVGVNERLAPARTSAGPRFGEPVTDNFQVAHFEANQVAFSHVVEIRHSGVSFFTTANTASDTAPLSWRLRTHSNSARSTRVQGC
jgi:hypothetical protein